MTHTQLVSILRRARKDAIENPSRSLPWLLERLENRIADTLDWPFDREQFLKAIRSEKEND